MFKSVVVSEARAQLRLRHVRRICCLSLTVELKLPCVRGLLLDYKLFSE